MRKFIQKNIRQKKVSMQDKILADIDDEIALLHERIKLKYGLTQAKARNEVNKALRKIMCSFPEKWNKK